MAIVCQFTLQGQQVVATSGNYNKASNGSISWTLGEVVSETMGSGQTKVTNGVQQPNLLVTSIFELENSGINLSAFPNPASGYVILKLENEQAEELNYVLFDMNGKLIEKKDINSPETIISFTELYPSTYFIKVLSKGKEVRTFKIEKIINQ